MLGPERLEVWQKAVHFVDFVDWISRRFATGTAFDLGEPMRQAAVAISSATDEASTRTSRKQYACLVTAASAALAEIVSQVAIARSRKLLPPEEFQALQFAIREQAAMLRKLRRTQPGDS